MTDEMKRRNLIAQWVFDTRSILGRFHLWLEDVDVTWLDGKDHEELRHDISFAGGAIERQLIMTAGVTALGTRLFGRFGEAEGRDKKERNRVKKDADAISAYMMSEALWYMTRGLPENHAVMVCLGEGLMPKVGETPEMGSNPLLGFGRIYARPQVAKFLDRLVQSLINDPGFVWDDFMRRVDQAGITIWGAAIDTLENTTRFAVGAPTGPMTVLHLFDQPLAVSRPYEGYMGNLILPREVVAAGARRSLLINYHTPRSMVMQAIRETWPDIEPGNVHVWTLTGKSRVPRIGSLWDEWREAGAHVVEDGWKLPGGNETFSDSGTYAPTYKVGTWVDDAGDRHCLVNDGYAASAEAMQAASLAPILDIDVSLAVFSSKFDLPWTVESRIMHLDPEAPDFPVRLNEAAGRDLADAEVVRYRQCIREARDAGIPLGKSVLSAEDFLPRKTWDVVAVAGYMLDDPYTGAPGVEKISDDIYRVWIRLSTPHGMKEVALTLRFMDDEAVRPLVCNPLLIRFFRGEDYTARAVKISDSGRIRNELQTLCSEALEHFGENGIRVHFDRISSDVISPEDQKILRRVLAWYKEHHPLWFAWLELD
ncbi:MAG: hypothetical protein JW819_11075 [Candidatus Krumholzibacteriota bacterium]|nr:hypothetical protein [Candidatus Krumholzibacteriota bacterium]